MKKAIALLLALVMLLSLAACSRKGSVTAITNLPWQVKVGGVITFGRYEQDNDTTNGKEPIEWIVLEKDGNKALVISKYCLDCQPYNEGGGYVTWEICSLRRWLNRTFLNDAFSNDEQERIVSTQIRNESSPDGIDGGRDTTDKVFLLSISEADTYFSVNSVAATAGTAYAIHREHQDALSRSNDYCLWWLRTPGCTASRAACVENAEIGDDLIEDNNAVRPVMWIVP